MTTTQAEPIRPLARDEGGEASQHRGRHLVVCLCAAGLLTGVAAFARADGDAAAGRKLYQNRCLSCHGDDKTTKATLGPSLVGIIGRKASDTRPGATSRGMTEADFTWTEATLSEYLAAPSNKVHGTIMPVGVTRPQDRDDLIAYIKSLD